jgi:hypothetical protein
MVILLALSAISVILILLYLIAAHYVLVMEISGDIEKAEPDVILEPFDPEK